MLAPSSSDSIVGITRFAGAAAFAASISLGLLFLMQSLIAGETFVPSDKPPFDLASPIWEEDPPLIVDDRPKPPQKPEPDILERPDPITITHATPENGITYERISADDNFIPISDVGPPVMDRGAYPQFRVQHQWPARAPASGGCVIVGFTITATGGVADAQVLDSSSSRFHRNAVKAVSEYKYAPWISNGVPIATPNQTIRLVWQYEGEGLPDHPACVR